jgi:hypothetical protein
MSTQAIQQIEHNIKQAKQALAFNSALDRLFANRDFKQVILDGYFREEAIRLVHLKADPNFQTAERQSEIMVSLDAIGNLSRFFVTTRQLATQAGNSITADEAMLEELLAEEVEQ